MPLRTAYKLCPQAIFVDGHPDRYREYSHKVHDVLQSVLPAGGDGVDRRGLSRYDRHRAPLRAAAARRAPAARAHEGGDQSQLLHRHRDLAPGRQDHLRPGQAERRPVDYSRAGGRLPRAARRAPDAGRRQGDREEPARCSAFARSATWRAWTRRSWKNASASGGWRSPESRAGSMPAAGSIPRSAKSDGPKSISHEHTFNEDTADLGPDRIHPGALGDGGPPPARARTGRAHRATQAALLGFHHHHARPLAAARHAARYRDLRGDPRALPAQLEARRHGAPAGRARLRLGRRRRAIGPARRRVATRSGSRRWPRPTACATGSANRQSRWPRACAATSASAPTKIRPRCPARNRANKRLPALCARVASRAYYTQ